MLMVIYSIHYIYRDYGELSSMAVGKQLQYKGAHYYRNNDSAKLYSLVSTHNLNANATCQHVKRTQYVRVCSCETTDIL